jgi:hypothetical protein
MFIIASKVKEVANMKEYVEILCSEQGLYISFFLN